MSVHDKFKTLCDQYTTGIINCDEFMRQSSQMLREIEELEQRINDMPTFYYKHSFIPNEQAIVIYEYSNETREVVRSFSIANGCTMEYVRRALRIAGMYNDSSDIHIHQDLTTTMSERGVHIVVDSQNLVRAVYKV